MNSIMRRSAVRQVMAATAGLGLLAACTPPTTASGLADLSTKAVAYAQAAVTASTVLVASLQTNMSPGTYATVNGALAALSSASAEVASAVSHQADTLTTGNAVNKVSSALQILLDAVGPVLSVIPQAAGILAVINDLKLFVPLLIQLAGEFAPPPVTARRAVRAYVPGHLGLIIR